MPNEKLVYTMAIAFLQKGKRPAELQRVLDQTFAHGFHDNEHVKMFSSLAAKDGLASEHVSNVVASMIQGGDRSFFEFLLLSMCNSPRSLLCSLSR